MSNLIKPISNTLVRRGTHSPSGKTESKAFPVCFADDGTLVPSMRLGAFAPVGTASHMGKSSRSHQASDPAPREAFGF